MQADEERDLCVLPSHVKLSQVGHLGQDIVRLVPNPSSGQLSPAGHFLVWVIDPAALQGGQSGDQLLQVPGGTYFGGGVPTHRPPREGVPKSSSDAGAGAGGPAQHGISQVYTVARVVVP